MENNLTQLLDIPNVKVVGLTIIEGIICFHIELNNSEIECPHCHSLIAGLHQTRQILIRDLSVFGKPTYLKVPRRRYYCRKCQRYSTERLEWLDWRRQHTQRYEAHIFDRIKGANIETVSQQEGISFDEVEGIFKHRAKSQIQSEWTPTKRISIDEIAQHKGHKDFKTVVSDLDQGKLIEVINGHNQEIITQTLMEQPLDIRKIVEEVSIDMWGGFASIIPQIFPNAVIVTDRFHVVKPLLNELKIIVNQVGIRGRNNLKLILTNKQDLNQQELAELEQLLQKSNRLRTAYNYKEEFRRIYEDSQTVEEGREEFTKWLQKAANIYGKVIETIRNHLDTICNYFLNRTTSGIMEGINQFWILDLRF